MTPTKAQRRDGRAFELQSFRAAHDPVGKHRAAANAPANTNVASYWDTNTVWIPFEERRSAADHLQPGWNPWTNHFFPGRGSGTRCPLYKHFRIREGVTLRFNFDAFNVFNHPNSSNSVAATGILDTRSQSNAARQLQLAIRLSW